MRESLSCPKCSHREILRTPLLDHGMHGVRTASATVVQVKKLGGLLTDAHPSGSISMYICRRCGFIELYADNPGSIPADAWGATVLRGVD